MYCTPTSSHRGCSFVDRNSAFRLHSLPTVPSTSSPPYGTGLISITCNCEEAAKSAKLGVRCLLPGNVMSLHRGILLITFHDVLGELLTHPLPSACVDATCLRSVRQTRYSHPSPLWLSPSKALSISRPITEQNQETRKPAAGSERNLEHQFW